MDANIGKGEEYEKNEIHTDNCGVMHVACGLCICGVFAIPNDAR